MTTIATKNGVPIIKGGSIATGCGCCGGGCDIQFPDSVEVEIQRTSSDYASIVIGSWPTGDASPTPEAAVGVAWVIPSGTFSLSLVPGISTSTRAYYGYTNYSLGIAAIQCEFQIAQNGNVTIGLLFAVACARQKAIANTTLPPTLQQLLQDDWAAGACLDSYLPTQTYGFSSYRIRRCSLGNGAVFATPSPYFSVGETCELGSGSRSRNATALNGGGSPAQLVCFSNGCTFPATCVTGSRLWIPTTDGMLINATDDLSYHRAVPSYRYILARSGNFYNQTQAGLVYVPTVEGFARGVVSSVRGVYAETPIDIFSQIVDSGCSLRVDASTGQSATAIYETCGN